MTANSVGSLDTGAFLGSRHASLSVGDVALSHWTANGPPYGRRHAHEDAHFMFVISGDYVSDADGGETPFGTSLIYNPPGICHDDHLAGGAGSFVSVTLGDALSRGADARNGPDRPVRLTGLRPQMLARQITRRLSSDDRPRTAELEALCIELACTVWNGGSERGPNRWLSDARERLSDPFSNTPSLQGLSESLGVHPVYLTRSFRRVYGCTPGEYARAVRLSAAARLIAGGRDSLTGIAALCGFADQSHLTNQFRQAFGFSPAKYRACTTLPRP